MKKDRIRKQKLNLVGYEKKTESENRNQIWSFNRKKTETDNRNLKKEITNPSPLIKKSC